MAYLNAQFSKQKLGVVADSVPVETGQLASPVNEELDNAENSNFQLARQLKEQKSKLINVLSQFPITALWLLNEYEQNRRLSKKNDETVLSTELSSVLADIKKYYQILSLKDSNDMAYDLVKQNLVTALQLFPLLFKI